MITNLTEGKPSSILWRFSIPLLISILFQQMYQMVDSAVVGRFVSENAMASVGASYPVTMIFMAIAAGGSIGASVIISQLFGGRDAAQTRTAISTTLISMAVIGLLLSGLGLLFCPKILLLLNTPADIWADSVRFLRIYCAGLLFLFLYNAITAVFNALGDSRTPLFFLILSSIANVVLDLIFVIRFHWGVAGVAWATLLAQGISAVLISVVLRRRLELLQEAESGVLFSWPLLGRIGRIALPSMIQQSFVSVGNLFIQTMVNGYGPAVVAGYSAAIRLNTLAITSFIALSNGLSSFTAQNVGARQYQRVRSGMRGGCVLALVVAVPFVVLYLGFSGSMIRLFIAEPTAEALHVGVLFLRIVAPFYLIALLKLMADGVLRGVGAVFAFTTSTMTDLVLRVVLAASFSYLLSSSLGIWLAWPFGWVVSTGVSLLFYRFGAWRKEIFKPE